MRKLFWVLIATLALAACNDDADGEKWGNVRATASALTINKHPDFVSPDNEADVPVHGVTIGGKSYTEYCWEEGDVFAVTSKGGVGQNGPEKMWAMNSGSENVHYTGNFTSAKEFDRYFAVYPYNQTLVGGTPDHYYAGEFWVNYTDQNASEPAALLTAMVENAKINELDFQFYPTNSLLHVGLQNAPQHLTKAVLSQRNGKSFTTQFQWDIYNNRVAGRINNASITVHAPQADGFFIALPPWLTLDDFTITLYSEEGVVMEKAYPGRTFEKGYTYLTTIDCQEPELPSVECGAMTSHDYYLSGKSAVANKMASISFVLGQKLSFGENGNSGAESRYYNIKDEDISSAGVIIKKEGETLELNYKLNFANGIIGANQEVNVDYYDIDWAKYTTMAYIELKDGTRISSKEKVHYVTGFPYDSYAGEYHGFYTEESLDLLNHYKLLKHPWVDITNGIVEMTNSFVFFRGHDHLHMESGLRWAQVMSPKFYIPENGLEVTAYWEISSAWNAREATTALLTSSKYGEDGTEVLAFDDGDYSHHKMTSDAFYLSPSYPYFQIELQTAFKGPWVRIHRLILEYK